MLYCLKLSLLINVTPYNYVILYRVPTQISFSNSLCFPCFFPVRLPIYVICDYYINKTDLADLSSFQKNGFLKKIFLANIEISFTFRITDFKTLANQIPCVFPVFWQNFQIPCVFPDGIFWAIFPVFSVPVILYRYFYPTCAYNEGNTEHINCIFSKKLLSCQQLLYLLIVYEKFICNKSDTVQNLWASPNSSCNLKSHGEGSRTNARTTPQPTEFSPFFT